MPDDPILDPQTGAEGQEPQESADDSQDTNIITLDRRNLHKELTRLQREDPEFANAFNTQVGNKAKRQYQPLLDEARAREDLLRQEIRRQQLISLPEREIQERFASDPEFAREYAALVHRDTARAEAESQQRMDAIRMSSAFEEVVAEALDLGMSKARVEEYVNAVRSGGYDKDSSGQPFPHWALGINALRDDIRSEMSKSTKKIEAEPESKIAGAGPDVSPTSGSSARGRPRYANATQAAQLFAEDKISAAEYREAKARLGW